ncbi:MAG: TetR/AcrR family transcriptional regulator [Ignavibacteriaceae bacterium]|nr:TetR/AcrR family transcriptional regulator [Ignavibacteriaceae bacterium]
MRLKEGNKELDIFEAAVKLIAKNGFHHAKMSKISEMAGVSIGSCYVYYKNKEDILFSVFRSVYKQLETIATDFADNESLSTIEKMDKLVDAFFDIFNKNQKLALVFVNEYNTMIRLSKGNIEHYNEFMELAESILKRGVERDEINPNLDIKFLRVFVIGGVRYMLEFWARENDKIKLDLLRNNVKQILRNGITKCN